MKTLEQTPHVPDLTPNSRSSSRVQFRFVLLDTDPGILPHTITSFKTRYMERTTTDVYILTDMDLYEHVVR